ncbi:hypothetical protein [Micromonospora sp. RP3T]|uniref:hypothetical protein n=1 Tax=Micromonospora sp. RP3T TaxID=2135446 RepID=UPI003D71E054
MYQAWLFPPDGSPPLDLNPPDQDWWSLKANSGLGSPPIELIKKDNPAGGVIVEGSRDLERNILWPFRMRSATHLGLLEVWRRNEYLITMTKRLGPARLRLLRPDGTAREILVYYSSGLEGEPGDGTWLEVTAVINFLAPDPYWRDVRTVVEEFREEAAVDYLDPYPSLSSGRVLGAVELVNDGHRQVWPTWRVRGPLTSLTAANNTTGRTFTFAHTLADGEVATISSRPIQVRGPAGENLTSALGLTAGGGKPWWLDPRRTSSVTFTAAGSAPDSAEGADDGTRIWLEYPIEYNTA